MKIKQAVFPGMKISESCSSTNAKLASCSSSNENCTAVEGRGRKVGKSFVHPSIDQIVLKCTLK